MIELFEQDVRTSDRQSSKGNQLKWENNGIWYKADYTGYEGLSEYVISKLLEKSTLSPDEYVKYAVEEIKYKTSIYKGARSKDFLEKGWQIITLERLFKNFFGESLYKSIYKVEGNEARLTFLVNQVERITGLKDFGVYMNKLLTIDAFFLNEDRHTHNIAVLMNEEGKFAYCPIFDNGAGLLSDTKMDYPMEKDVTVLIDEVHAKTFSRDFDEQMFASEKLYGRNLWFQFNRDDVKEILEQEKTYTQEEKDRIEKVILIQMRKYQYLFKV